MIEAVDSKLRQLRYEQSLLAVRLQAVQRMRRRLVAHSHQSDPEEFDDTWYLGVVGNLEQIESDLGQYIDHLDDEMGKIIGGVERWHQLTAEDGKDALAWFMLEDLRLSLDRVTRARQDYDHLKDSFRELRSLLR